MKISKLQIIHKNKTLVDIKFQITSSLALVGQSGSGKSLTIKALLNMLSSDMKLTLHVKSDFDLIAGKTIGFVPQNPFTALSPLTKIKSQFFIPSLHVKKLFQAIDLDINLLNRYPSELSGGQLQRIIIAISLSSNPKILLLDEPTTALDPGARLKILNLLIVLQQKMKFKILFVTHDINSAKLLCEDICVICDGLVVETGKMTDVLNNPQKLYTKKLIESNFSIREFRK